MDDNVYDLDSARPRRAPNIPPDLIERLRIYGIPPSTGPWADYSAIELTDEVAADLVKIVDGEGDELFDSDRLCWVPLHAWRILLVNKYIPAIPALLHRVLIDGGDDWSREDIGFGLAAMGPAIIKPISDLFHTEKTFAQDAVAYAAIVEALVEVAGKHASTRGEVLGILRGALARFESLPPIINAYVVGALADLGDADADIQKVFERGFVDEKITSWESVRKKLPGLPFSVRRRKYASERPDYGGDDAFQKALEALGTDFNVDEVKCWMLGLQLALDPIRPEELLEGILEEAGRAGGGFQSEGQAAYFRRELSGLWHHIAVRLGEDFPLPKVVLPTRELPVVEENATKLYWTRMYISAFCDGLASGDTNEASFEEGLLRDFIGFMERAIKELERLERRAPSQTAVVEAALEKVYAYWNEHFLDFSRMLLEYEISE